MQIRSVFSNVLVGCENHSARRCFTILSTYSPSPWHHDRMTMTTRKRPNALSIWRPGTHQQSLHRHTRHHQRPPAFEKKPQDFPCNLQEKECNKSMDRVIWSHTRRLISDCGNASGWPFKVLSLPRQICMWFHMTVHTMHPRSVSSFVVAQFLNCCNTKFSEKPLLEKPIIGREK